MSLTQDEIIRMAREAAKGGEEVVVFTLLELERFAALVTEATKEKAAKVCEKWAEHAEGGYVRAYTELSTAIRSMK